MNEAATVELSIVVPTIDLLAPRVKRCIDAVRGHTDIAHEVVVLENRAPPQGWTDPVNAGVRAAQGRYVVVMNDDVEVQERWWPPLRKALDDGASLAVPGAAAYNRDHFAGFCFGLRADNLPRLESRPGCLFDPDMKVWFSDLDMLLRLLQAGTPPVVVPESKVIHYGGETVLSKEPDGWIDRQIKRDRAVFFEKWPGGRKGEKAAALLSALPAPKPRRDRVPRSETAGKPPRRM